MEVNSIYWINNVENNCVGKVKKMMLLELGISKRENKLFNIPFPIPSIFSFLNLYTSTLHVIVH